MRAKAIVLALLGLSTWCYAALMLIAPERAGQRSAYLSPTAQAVASGAFGLLLMAAAGRLWFGSRRKRRRLSEAADEHRP